MGLWKKQIMAGTPRPNLTRENHSPIVQPQMNLALDCSGKRPNPRENKANTQQLRETHDD